MLYTNWDKSDRGVDVFLEWLRRDGTDWSKHPTREDAMREYDADLDAARQSAN